MDRVSLTIVPLLADDGEPCVRVELLGVEPESNTVIDRNGAELVIAYVDGKYHVVDYRGADAVDG